jgi:hypothetical protein
VSRGTEKFFKKLVAPENGSGKFRLPFRSNRLTDSIFAGRELTTRLGAGMMARHSKLLAWNTDFYGSEDI